MRRRFFSSLICGALAAAALTSCGSDKAGGTGEFATVYATATSPGGDVTSDVATWVDATTGAKATACGANSVPTVSPDTANYTITSTVFGGSTTVAPSDLIIDKVTLTLNPANTTTPALPLQFQTQYLTSGQRVPAGGVVTIPVVIASDQLKELLGTGAGWGNTPLDCTGLTYSYRATVTFEALEVTTNRVANITAPGFLLINFSDFIDK